MSKTQEEKHQFLHELYTKHYELILKYREENPSELDDKALDEIGRSCNDENPSNDVELFTEEAIAKALALTIDNIDELKR